MLPRTTDKRIKPPLVVFSKATIEDVPQLAQIGKKLWPKESATDLRSEFASYVRSKKDCLFVVRSANSKLIGFIHGSLRFEYVEGAQSSPVAYLEGLYVDSQSRRKGFGWDLVRLFETWTREQNCDTLASDTHLVNRLSQRAHHAFGYQRTATVVHFLKKLK